jgi:two-component system, sensor histidine kinase
MYVTTRRMITEKPKILIVDDNQTNTALVEMMLRGLETELVSVSSGEEAIRQTDLHEFALVLMDISMPGMDGFETVERIRHHKENQLLNVIYMTAYNDEMNLQIRGMRTGAVDFISKPINRELFVGKVNIFLNLYKQRKSLEAEISKRMVIEEELIRAREVAEEAARAKQQFLSVMSHEIRTPLNAIINTTQFLMDADPRKDQLDNMGTLQFSADSLVQLVNQILEYSKIDAGKIEFENTDFELRELVRWICQSLEPEAFRKGLSLESYIGENIPIVLKGDCSRLSQILMNLVGNAIKFTEKGKISLSVETLKDHEDKTELAFSVTDTGIGIAAGQLGKIFESFTQAGSTTSKEYGGTGLGLAITKKLVELQGGHIEVKSRPGHGSTFSFTLGFKKSRKQHLRALKPLHMEYRSLKGLKVLVAEDNIVNQKIVLKILSKWDAFPDIAENGKVAVQKIRKNHYNLVLMDLHMPEMSGYDATLAVRKLKGDYYRDLPIIALTATAFAEDKNKFASFGMNGYIIKPFTPPELYSKITHFVK